MSCKHIIPIGSSAGGMEPMRVFFDQTLLDHSAYFILNHLPIDYQSLSKEILSKHTDLTVTEATDGLMIEENHVYTLPVNKFIVLENGKLALVDRERMIQKANWACDIFLGSLVKHKLKNIIAVILSGAGTDGSIGISGIKEIGGKVIVQTPDSCECSSMPLHAIKTGLVDYIALPAEMPVLISDHIAPHMADFSSIE
jgi:two-component system CheB/CheR fusion protein